MRLLPAALVLLLVFLVACSDNDDPSPAQPDATTTTVPGSVTPEDSKPITAEPTPSGVASNETVRLSTSDGVTLTGHLYEVPGPKRQVIVIAATVPQSTWRPYVAELTARGIALLTIDPRGVGETGGPANDAMLPADLSLAMLYIKSREYPLVYLMGIGGPVASAALRTAAQQELAGVAALPAGGVTNEEIARVTEPKLLMAFDTDAAGVQELDRLVQAASEPKRRILLQPGAAGPVQDVLSLPTVRQAILDFLAR
jgi:hypothetical protein